MVALEEQKPLSPRASVLSRLIGVLDEQDLRKDATDPETLRGAVREFTKGFSDTQWKPFIDPDNGDGGSIAVAKELMGKVDTDPLEIRELSDLIRDTLQENANE